ncbi:MAG: efflux RND transporter periplasmic adaptor subunit [Paludibacteraceae bacterium]
MRKSIYVLCVALGLAQCQGNKQTEYERQAIPVRVVEVAEATSVHSHSYIGTIAEDGNTPLSFPSGGTVTAIHVRAGQQVRAGEVLMTVDNTQAKSLLASAQAKLRQAEDGYKRIEQIYQSGGATEVKLIEVRTQRDEARAMVATLQKQLTDCTLRAPKDGTIGAVLAEVGQNVLPGQKVGTLIRIEVLNVQISVPEADMSGVHIGGRCTMRMNALEGVVLHGSVSERALLPNPLTHAYEVRIMIDTVEHAMVRGGEHSGMGASTLVRLPTNRDNTSDRTSMSAPPPTPSPSRLVGINEAGRGSSPASPVVLLPGMVCRVTMDEQRVEGILLPAECIQTGQQGKTVWVLQGGRAIRQQVATGPFVGEQVLITDGLRRGDRVVTAGIQKLYNGCEVIVQ